MIASTHSLLAQAGVAVSGTGDVAELTREIAVIGHGIRSNIVAAVEEYREQSNTILDHDTSIRARGIADAADQLRVLVRVGSTVPSASTLKRVMLALEQIVLGARALKGILDPRKLNMIVALAKRAFDNARELEHRAHAPSYMDVLGQ